jgi:predicted lipoprotein with Yx(FWY)xxD motif
MTRSKLITSIASAAAVPVLALAVAACGGGGSATAAAPASTSTANAHAQTGTVRVANSSLGSILVDSSGRTLYLFKADSGTKSACSGACATAWPPLRTAGKPTAGSGAEAALLGTTPRSDGAAQVTYNGHPLYLYVADKKPGDVTGQALVAFGAPWYVVSPAGQQITSQSTSSPAGTGGGY